MNDLSLTASECYLLQRCLFLAASTDVFLFDKEEAEMYVPLTRKLGRIIKLQIK